MYWNTAIIVDTDDSRRNAVYRSLHPLTATIPLASVADLGEIWPESAWFVVFDDNISINALHRAFAERGRFHPIVVLAEELVPSRMVAAIHGGAMSYGLWPCTGEQLIANLHGVEGLARKRCESSAERLEAQHRLSKLTPRELDVMRLMRQGLSNKEIGRQLEISSRTVEIHRANAIGKLGVGHSVGATALLIAAEDGISPPFLQAVNAA